MFEYIGRIDNLGSVVLRRSIKPDESYIVTVGEVGDQQGIAMSGSELLSRIEKGDFKNKSGRVEFLDEAGLVRT